MQRISGKLSSFTSSSLCSSFSALLSHLVGLLPSIRQLTIPPYLSFQVLLSNEDLKMMIDEVSGKKGEAGTVNLNTFILIMEKSSW